MFYQIGEGHKIINEGQKSLRLAALNSGEPDIRFFYQGKSQLTLSNSVDDQVIIPYELLPEPQRDGRQMINVVETVRYLVKIIQEQKAENAELRNELRAAMEKY